MKLMDYRFIKEHAGEAVLKQSALNKENEFPMILSMIYPQPKICIELGTLRGVSTAVLVKNLCDIVYTFDIKQYPECESLWNSLKVLPQIVHYIVKERNKEKEIIDSLSADFAFVDTIHDYENVKLDFEMVKKCGRVLFHDAHFPEVRKFLKEIGAQLWGREGVFGYWINEEARAYY